MDDFPILISKKARWLPKHEDSLASLEAAKAPCAIVTSVTRPVVTGWPDTKLAHPRSLGVAKDVKEGKPG